MEPRESVGCLSSRVSSESLAAEREILDSWIPADFTRPVYSAIRNAFIEHFSLLYLVLVEKGSNPGPEVTPAELKQLDKNCRTLGGLLFPRSNVWAARDSRKSPILKFLLRCLQRKKGGRPLTKLRNAAQAKELRMADPKRWKWKDLTEKFCGCGKKEHSISCQDNLRREVLHLDKLLKSCGHTVETGKTP